MRCIWRHEEKDFSCFHRKSGGGIRSQCKTCMKEYMRVRNAKRIASGVNAADQRAWVAKDGNKEKTKGYQKKYMQNNKEKLALRFKTWYEKNKKVLAERRKATDTPEKREKRLLSNQRWSKENPEQSYLRTLIRRKKIRRATPAWFEPEVIELIYAEAKHRGLQVDHVIPLHGRNVCGLHVHNNMQLLSVKENRCKNNKFPYPSRIPL